MVIDFIKKLLGKDVNVSKQELNRLQMLSPDRIPDELGTILSKVCINLSADFVKNELTRAESPFRELDKFDFFYEMLILNFWIVDKVFSKHLQHLSKTVLAKCSEEFPHAGEIFAMVPDRFKRYYYSWDSHTGHQDLFALDVCKSLYGTTPFPERQASFWIITYTDDSIKAFKKVRAACRKNGLFVKTEDKK